VDAHVDLGKTLADILWTARYARPGTEAQFVVELDAALHRATRGAIPGRIQAPRNDTWEALQEQQAYRRRFERTGSTRPPHRVKFIPR
jgi:hypothetical protein